MAIDGEAADTTGWLRRFVPSISNTGLMVGFGGRSGTVLAGWLGVGLWSSLFLAGCAFGGVFPDVGSGAPDHPPLSERIAWDGEQFVINDLGHSGEQTTYHHWTSPDGVEWRLNDGPSPAGPQGFALWDCHPDFRCDVEPADVEQLPFHFAETRRRVAAVNEAVMLLEVWTNYEAILLHHDGRPGDRIHPDLAAAASRHSDCFAQALAIARADPDGMPEPGQTRIGGSRTAYEGEWTIDLDCEDNGASETFTLDLARHLDKRRLEMLSRGSERELVAVTAGGDVVRVSEPPTVNGWQDGIAGPEGRLLTGLSPIAATADRFWAPHQGSLVSSLHGVNWDVVELGTEGQEVGGVIAGPGGDIALLLVDDARVDGGSAANLVTSHDNGVSWTEPIRVDENRGAVWLSSVGPAGAAVTLVADMDAFKFVSSAPGREQYTFTSGTSWHSEPTVGESTVLRPVELDDPNGFGPFVRLEIYDSSGELLTLAEP